MNMPGQRMVSFCTQTLIRANKACLIDAVHDCHGERGVLRGPRCEPEVLQAHGLLQGGEEAARAGNQAVLERPHQLEIRLQAGKRQILKVHGPKYVPLRLATALAKLRGPKQTLECHAGRHVK